MPLTLFPTPDYGPTGLEAIKARTQIEQEKAHTALLQEHTADAKAKRLEQERVLRGEAAAREDATMGSQTPLTMDAGEGMTANTGTVSDEDKFHELYAKSLERNGLPEKATAYRDSRAVLGQHEEAFQNSLDTHKLNTQMLAMESIGQMYNYLDSTGDVQGALNLGNTYKKKGVNSFTEIKKVAPGMYRFVSENNPEGFIMNKEGADKLGVKQSELMSQQNAKESRQALLEERKFEFDQRQELAYLKLELQKEKQLRQTSKEPGLTLIKSAAAQMTGNDQDEVLGKLDPDTKAKVAPLMAGEYKTKHEADPTRDQADLWDEVIAHHKQMVYDVPKSGFHLPFTSDTSPKYLTNKDMITPTSEEEFAKYKKEAAEHPERIFKTSKGPAMLDPETKQWKFLKHTAE